MKLRFLCGLLFLLTACVSVKDLDDGAAIASCSLVEVLPSQVVMNDPVVLEGNKIVLPLDYGKYLFPITVDLQITTAQTIDKILGYDQGSQLVFDTPESVRSLHLIALSGVVHSYSVSIELLPRSEEAQVVSCALNAFSPDDVLMSQDPIVDKVASRIDLLALADAVSYPLEVLLDCNISEGATLIGDLSEGHLKVSFTESSLEKTVNVIASSGKTQQWKVRLVPVKTVTVLESSLDSWERMQPGQPFSFSMVRGAQSMGCQVNFNESKIYYSLREQEPFPWAASLKFTINPYTQVLGLLSEESFSVASWEDSKTFYVLDEIDYQARRWNLVWERWLSPHNAVLDFNVKEYTGAQQQMVIGPAVVDTSAALITVPIISGADFPLIVSSYEMTLSDGATSSLPQEFVFDTHASVLRFTVTAQNGGKREWTLKLDPWFKTQADVYTFTVERFHSQQQLASFASPNATVDSLNGILTLSLKSGYDFPLVIDAFRMDLSPGATLVESFPQGMAFESVDDTVSFTVCAQSMDKRLWSLVLLDERTENVHADVTGYKIQSYYGTSNTSNNLKMNTVGVVDSLSRTITLEVTDWSSKLPLTVRGLVLLSKNARIVEPEGFASQHELVFENLQQTFSFMVRSESGTVEKEWTLCLKDSSPVRSNEAQVLQFVTGEPAQGFVFDSKYLEPDKAEIVLLLSERPSKEALLSLAPRLTVSQGARLSGITSGAPMELSFSEPTKFKVIAADESEKEWNIRLVYAPQIYNSGFEQWNTVNSVYNVLPANGNGWITGNNSQVSGSFKVAGNNSPSAVRMYTQLKTMNLVIYKVTSLAAGALFVGNFTLKVSAEDVFKPSNMSDFGIPFTADSNPVAFEIDYQYHSGGQRQFTEPKYGSLIPAFRDPVAVSGPDKALITTEIHNFNGTPWKYDLEKRENMVAQAEFYTEGAAGWTRLHMPFTYLEGAQGKKMTHIVIRITSSYEGHKFKGAHGSELLVDNYKLIYYEPSEKAVILD